MGVLRLIGVCVAIGAVASGSGIAAGGAAAGGAVVGGVATRPDPWLGRALSGEALAVRGVLDNGVRYVVMPRAKPAKADGGAVGVVLRIAAGSAHERSGELGWALLSEHVAFAQGERDAHALAAQRRLGIDLERGRHSRVSRTETVFALDFDRPDGLDDALALVGGLVRPGAVGADVLAQERRAIESERRARGDRDWLLREALLGELSPGSGLGERPVLGRAEDLAGATPEGLYAFVERVWRPERMSVAVVGAVDVERAVVAIEGALGALDSPGEAMEPRWRVRGGEGLRAVVLHDPRVVGEEASWIDVGEAIGPARDERRFGEILLDLLAGEGVRARLDARAGASGVVETQVYDVEVPGLVRLRETAAQGDPTAWPGLVEAITRVRRSLAAAPLTGAEIEAARRRVLHDLRAQAERERHGPAIGLARRAAALLGSDAPVLTLAQEHAAAVRLNGTISDEAVRERAAALYGIDRGVVVVKTGGVRPSADDLLGVVERVVEDPGAGPAGGSVTGARARGLAELPGGGPSARSVTVHAGSGVASVRLAGGVLVHHKQLVGIEGEVRLRVSLSGGVREESVLDRGVTSAAAGVLGGLWVGGLEPWDVRAAIAGAGVEFFVRGEEDAMTFEVACGVEEVDIASRLLGAMLATQRIDDGAFEAWRDRARGEAARSGGDRAVAMNEAVLGALVPGEPAWTRRVRPQDIDRLDAGVVNAWWARLRDDAPAEIAVVGAIERGEAIALARRVAGVLAERSSAGGAAGGAVRGAGSGGGGAGWSARSAAEAGSIARRVTGELASGTSGGLPEGRAVVGVVSATGGYDRIEDLRAVVVSARILRERLTRRLRGELGIASDVEGRVFPSTAGAGTLRVSAACEPEDAERVLGEMLAAMESLASSGASEAEVASASAALASSAEASLGSVEFWARWLSGSEARGVGLDGLATMYSSYARMTPERLNSALREAVAQRGLLEVVLLPGAGD
ncbi:MAG: pitrilysin family protein [Planctomycetota bacterium]